MGIVTYKFYLDNAEINPPVNWQSIQVLATFDQSAVQANITTEDFEFVNEAAQTIREYIAGGVGINTLGIFEGLPFRIEVTDGTNTTEVFDGFLDFNDYEEISPVRVKCRVKKSNGLNQLDERSQANSFGYLEDQGFITNADYVDVDYIVEKLEIESDVAIVTLALFLLTLQIAKSVADLQKELNTSAAIAATATPTAPVAGGTNLTLNAAIEIAYLAGLVIQAITLISDLVELLIPPIRKHKGMRLRRMMDKASSYLGYTYDSPLNELDNLVYLPSKPTDDKPITKGIPRASDFGYRLSEAFELINTMTNSKIQVDGNTIIQRSLNDPFWVQNATYKVPDVLDEKIKYNNADFNARTFINFVTDGLDDWTIDNFRGTNYEIIVTPIQGEGSPNNLMKGLDEWRIPLALGTPKDDYNVLERFFLGLFTAIDAILTPAVNLVNAIINLVGGSNPIPQPNLKGLITKRLGVLKVGQKNHGIAKLLYLSENSRIPLPPTDRNNFSARVLWNKYHNYNSFVSNDFGGQRRIFIEKVVPFGFSDFLKCIENSYFETEDGRIGKVEAIRWTLNDDKASLDYWIEEVYTENLKEIFVEG